MSGKYFPAPPDKAGDAKEYAYAELQDLTRALAEAQEITWMQVLAAPPEKPRIGMIAYANGSDWDPGSGGGPYVFNGSGWVPLHTGGSGSGANLTYTAATRVIASDTGTDATLPLVTSGDAGLAPASGGGTTNFLRADATWAAPPGGGASTLDGLTDVTITTPANGEVLKYNGSIWVNGTDSTGGGGTGNSYFPGGWG